MTKQVDYSFTDYMAELWNLYQVRAGMSSANSARHILDLREEVYLSWLEDVPAQEFYLEDVVWSEE